MKQEFLFTVEVNYGYKTVIYKTNAIMSKNDGALIAFRDENNRVNYSNQEFNIAYNKYVVKQLKFKNNVVHKRNTSLR